MDLLAAEILKETDYEHPVTVQKILEKVQERWRNIFPDDTAESISELTVRHHIEDLKESNLLDIRRKNLKL